MAGLQRYHAHGGGAPEEFPNGSAAHYGRTMHGRHLAYVRNCPCDKGISPRTAYVTGEPDTFFSIPAAVRVRGRNVRGFLTMDTEEGLQTGAPLGWRFTPNACQEIPAPPPPRYEVQSFDVCISGYERLRSPAEFILVAYPRPQWGARALRDAWLDDLRVCDRGDSFDYDAARRAVRAWCADLAKRLRAKGGTLGRALGGFDSGENGCAAFLYIRDMREE